MTDDSDDPTKEVIGKGRPPTAHRFKPGTSGNPKGRPNGYRNFKKLFENVLNRERRSRHCHLSRGCLHDVGEGGHERRFSRH